MKLTASTQERWDILKLRQLEGCFEAYEECLQLLCHPFRQSKRSRAEIHL